MPIFGMQPYATDEVVNVLGITKYTNTDKNSEDWDGFSIQTTNGDIHFTISQDYSCCEVVGVDIFHRSSDNTITVYNEANRLYRDTPQIVKCDLIRLNELIVNKRIISAKWLSSESACLHKYNADDDDSDGYSDRCIYTATVEIALVDNELIHLVGYNDHNGFYPHSVHVNWRDYSDTSHV